MWASELNLAAEIAREAGKVLLEIYATNFSVEFKGQGTSNPVTEADKRANRLIVTRLRAAFPDDGIIAEESELARDALTHSRIWYVDPLDGTKEFVAKNGEFSVMIGLSVDGRAQLGVVFQPSTQTLFAGAIGAKGAREHAAWLEHGGERRELRVSEHAAPSELGLIVSRSHRPASTEELIQRLGIRRETSSGSVGLKVGHIAQRHADLYVHTSNKASAWDACAPEAILIAAGGRFTDLAGDPIRYGSEDLRMRRGLLACNGAAFGAVAPVVRELAQRHGFIP
jgi:3'(2'), 5'-bisphosphate nucleotidase